MPTVVNLMGSGNSPLTTQASLGVPKTGLTAAGNNQATAFALPSDFNVFSTVSSSTGTTLPPSPNVTDTYIVVNHGAQTLSVYPATATGKIANGSAGAAFSVAATKTATFLALGSDTWAASLSA